METIGSHKSLKRKFFHYLIRILIIVFILAAGFAAGLFWSGKYKLFDRAAAKEAYYLGQVVNKYEDFRAEKVAEDVDFDIFWQVWDELEKNYVDQEKLSEKKMFYGALRGMVASVGDPYTVFMDPKISQDFSDDLAGKFEGIGAEIGIKNNILTIIAPLPDMPAEKAGLMPGDKVAAINGESTAGISIDEAVNKIRGSKGTEVVLTIVREGSDVSDYNIERNTIVVKSVHTNMRDDNIFVIEVTNFNDDTEELFGQAVKEAIKNNPIGLILDLRSNPGGYLDTAIEMSSEWIENEIVVVEKHTDDNKIEHLSRGRARLKDVPTVVLVNRGSASASEIVSGALQDFGKAIIVGEKTFGKGSVQTVFDFSDGSSIKVTIAKWLTPRGRSINEEGIMPDILVKNTFEDFNNNKDPQLDKAVDILTRGLNLEEAILSATTTEATSTETSQ